MKNTYTLRFFTTIYVILISSILWSQPSSIGTMDDSSPMVNEMEDEIDINKYVGQIPYSHSVTPTGGKSYIVPIETTLVNGIKPNISMVYNSQSGNGLLGMGWGLSGVSSITVANKSIYYDNEVSAPKTNDSDLAFTLDGVRLVPSQRLNGYPLETTQGQILVQPIYSNNDTTDIEQFQVLYPNGNKGIFKQTYYKDYSYNIISIEDTKGYRIDFEYEHDIHEINVISKIKYGGRDVTSHPSWIEFQYTNRNDIPNSFIFNRNVRLGKLLTKINSYNENEILKTYTLSHELNDVYQLIKIDCSAGSSSLNPLKFKYGENQSSAPELIRNNQMLLSTYLQPFGTVCQRGRFYKDDYNEGIITYTHYSNYTKLATETFFGVKHYKYGSGYNPNQPILIASKLSSLSEVQTIYTGEGFQQLSCADIDGDGVDEIIQLNIVGFDNNGYCILQVGTYKFNSSPTYKFYGIDGVIQDGPFINSISRSYYFGDYNGDGKVDLLTISHNRSYKGDIRTSIFTIIEIESGNILYSEPCFPHGPENANHVYIMDYDGDGKSDICHIGVNQTDIFSLTKQSNGAQTLQKICSTSDLKQINVNGREVQLADYNGDGKHDFIILPKRSLYYSRPLRVYEFDQGCEEAYELMTPGHSAYMILKENYPGDRYRIMVCSINEDSYYVEDLDRTEDILYTDNKDIWEIYQAKGENGFNYKSMSITRTREDEEYVIMDIDKNGYPDILQKSPRGISVHLQKNGIWESEPTVNDPSIECANTKLLPTNLCNYGKSTELILLKSGMVESYFLNKDEGSNRLLTSMTDSYGIRHTNYYTQMTSQEVYSPGNKNRSYPYNNFIAPLNLLEKTFVHNSIEGYNILQETYKYHGAVLHRTGLGFCGFEKIEMFDEIKGYTNIDEKDPEKFGVSIRTVNPIGEYNYTYQENKSGKCSNILLKSLSESNKLTGNIITKEYEYDNLCNRTKETVTYDANIKSIIEQTYDNLISSEKYILGIPRIKKSTQIRDLDSWEESEEINYYSNWLPQEKLFKVGNNLINKTTWTYNTNGSVLNEKNVPYNATSSTSKNYIYDTKNRIIESCDELGRETYYLQYNKLGIPTSTKNFYLQTTDYTYDAFGRTQSITHPHNRISTITHAWESTIGLYSVTQEETGKPTKKIYYDALDREIQIATQCFDGSWQYIKKEYDNRGRLSKVSLPFKEGGTIHWTIYGYDNYDRQTSLTEASGKSVQISYSGNNITTTENGITKTNTYDSSGLLIKVTDPTGIITYNYRADGQLKGVVAPGNIITSLEYDQYGRKNKIIDPSAGITTINENYEGYKHIVTQTDANNKTTTIEYDLLGRILKEYKPEFNTTYSYDPYVYEIGTISSTNGIYKEYSYNLDLLTEEKETGPNGVWFQRNYTYTSGDLTKIVYRSSKDRSIATEYRIYTNGYLTEIKLNDIVVWKLAEENELGQPTKVITGPLTRTYGYNAYGSPTFRKANNLQNFSYSFDIQTGNLLNRIDETRNITEQFTYDNINRLIQHGNQTVDYDYKGNITNMSEIGNMTYEHTSKPYAVSGITFTSNLAPRNTQEITYSSFQRPTTISDATGHLIEFTYDENGERIKMSSSNGSTQSVRYYLGGIYETDETESRLFIGGNAYSAPAVYIKKNGSWDIYYICRDYLGSITHIANSSGNLVQELSYDAWGRLRNPVNQIVYTPGNEPTLFLGRGYTGHEHLITFGLINMNARLYDPALGRFLSPDPYVQAPDNCQNFNRYSYCLNNPLLYTDISGEVFGIDDLIAAIIGGTINVIVNIVQGNVTSVGQGFALFGAGALSGVLTIYTGPVGGGAFLGAANSALNQGFNNGWGNIDWNQVTGSGLMSAATSFLGSELGSYLSKPIGSLTSSIGNPILKEALTQGALNSATGFALGTGMAFASGEDWDDALKQGVQSAAMGLATGVISGTAVGLQNNRGGYSVYEGRDGDDNVRYVGITERDVTVRAQEHLNSNTERAELSYKKIPGTGKLSRMQARIMEQKLINKYGLQKNNGQLFNKINSIAPKYWYKYGIKQ